MHKHSRVYQISGDRIYALLTGGESALADLYRALPKALADFMATQQQNKQNTEDAALTEIQRDAKRTERSIVDQISFENFGYYLGFDKL